MNTIIYVNENVLCYKDEYGDDVLIDLKKCNENWIRYKVRMNYENKQPDTIIGQRDICSSPCFIELFTRPFTRFTFDGQEAIEKFKYWTEELQKAGWHTFDLS